MRKQMSVKTSEMLNERDTFCLFPGMQFVFDIPDEIG